MEPDADYQQILELIDTPISGEYARAYPNDARESMVLRAFIGCPPADIEVALGDL